MAETWVKIYREGGADVAIADGGTGASTAAAAASALGVGTEDSPVFTGLKLSGLTDLKIPKHVSDAVGLADTTITVSANNEMTNPSQPAVLTLHGAQSNVTGDGTTYTVTFATEIYDQNSDFDGTSTFTAPVTGRYLISVSLYYSGFNTSTNHVISFVASNRTILARRNYASPHNVNVYTYGMSIPMDMDAADTLTITLQVAGTGSKNVDLENEQGFLGVVLLC